jgi:SAM-dependent methyltransferase
MNHDADTPQPAVTLPSPQEHAAPAGSSQPAAEVAVERDTTLKWIVPEDAVPDKPLPPIPVAARRERTPPPLPLPTRRTTPPPVPEPPKPEAAGTKKLEPAVPPTPPPDVTPKLAMPPQQGATPVQEAPPAAPVAVRSPEDKTEPRGATPSEYVIPDPTPPPPVQSAPAEGLGAAPEAVLPGPASSDSELSADAVELIPAAADEAAPPSRKARLPDPDATPREGMKLDTTTSVSEATAAGEPREVEPEAVEIVESAEHQTVAEPSPPAVPHHKPTPPPVRPDVAALTPPPVPPEMTGSRAAVAPRSPTLAAALFEDSLAPTAGGEQLPEALARRSLQKRSKPWFEEVFDEDYLRTLPYMTAEQTAHEARFIQEALSPPKGGEVLDVACGYGRHALELAQHGFHVTGLDLSLPLLIRAADDAQKRGLAVNFVHADMREMTFNAQFDGAYCVLSSFGYFDEETNLRVASAICRALKPGGKFLLDILNRDYVVADLPSRVWWEGDGCVVLEEVDFNYHTSRVLVRRSVVFGNGRQTEQEISMRAYSLHEVGKLLRQAGLRVLQVSGGMAAKSRFFGASSRNIIAVCERPTT